MSNVLERVSRAILAENELTTFMFNSPENQAKMLAKAGIYAICDEIDEGAFKQVIKVWMGPSIGWQEDIKRAIQTYLNHLKSTTEIKGAV